MSLDSPAAVREALAGEHYLADWGLSVAVYLASSLEQPLHSILVTSADDMAEKRSAVSLGRPTALSIVRLLA